MKNNLKFSKPTKRVKWEEELWKVFSQYVRLKGSCEFHRKLEEKGIPSPCSCNGVFQACHKISRSKKIIKFDERNIFCGCSGSNTWSHFNEQSWGVLWRKLWSEDVEYLEEKQRQKYIKRSNWTYAILIKEYQQKINELKGTP